MSPCCVADRTETLDGIAVKMPLTDSVLVGPASSAVTMDVSGAGDATNRVSSTSWLDESKKYTRTPTSDEGLGCVVVVVGRRGSIKSNGTLEGAMVLGAPWVGMAQPAVPSARRSTATGRRRRRCVTSAPPRRRDPPHPCRNPRPRRPRPPRRHRPGLRPQETTGRNAAPPSGDDSTRTVPRMTRTCSATKARPSPVPVPGAAPTRGRTAIEALEHLGPLLGVDARAGVVDRDLDLVVTGSRRDGDLGDAAPVVRCVLHEVDHDPLEAAFVDAHAPATDLGVDPDLGGAAIAPAAAAGGHGHLVQAGIHVPEAGHDRSLYQLGDVYLFHEDVGRARIGP